MIDFMECLRRLSQEAGGKMINFSGAWIYKIEGEELDKVFNPRRIEGSFSKITAEVNPDSDTLEVCLYVDDWLEEREVIPDCPEPFSGSFSFEKDATDTYEGFVSIFIEGLGHLYSLADEYFEMFLDDDYLMVLAYKDGDGVKFVKSSLFSAEDDVDAEQKGREVLMSEYPKEMASSIGTYLINYNELSGEYSNEGSEE